MELAVRAAVGGGGDTGVGVGEVDWQRWWWWWWCPAAAGVIEGSSSSSSSSGSSSSGSSGSGSCISALPEDLAGWASTRARCKSVGGDLLTTPPSSITLRPLLHSTYSPDAPPMPSYWVGGRKVLGEWRWVTGEFIEGEFSERESGDCLVVLIGESGGVEMAASPCHTPHPALCQLPTPSSDASRPPLDPESNEVAPIAAHHYLTPEDLNLA